MNKTEALSALGVKSGATLDEITKAFRKLSVEKHPDRGGSEGEYKKITEAYSYLKENDGKPEYNPFVDFNDFRDAYVKSHTYAYTNSNWPFGGVDVGDFFNRAVYNTAHLDIKIVHEISFKDAHLGCNKKITFKRKTLCQKCSGSGCDHCNSTGLIEEEVSQSILVPRFSSIKNPTFQVGGYGNYDSKTKRVGKLIISLRIIPNPAIKVLEDGSVISDLKISLLESLVGISKEIETLGGNKKIKIPGGVQNKQRLKIQGGAIVGDHYVNLLVENPTGEKLDNLIEFLKLQEDIKEKDGVSS